MKKIQLTKSELGDYLAAVVVESVKNADRMKVNFYTEVNENGPHVVVCIWENEDIYARALGTEHIYICEDDTPEALASMLFEEASDKFEKRHNTK